MNVNYSISEATSRISRIYERVVEIMFFVLVTPAVFSGLLALERLPF